MPSLRSALNQPGSCLLPLLLLSEEGAASVRVKAKQGGAHGLRGRAAALGWNARSGPALLRPPAPPGRAPGPAPGPSATAATNEVRGRRWRTRARKGGRSGPQNSAVEGCNPGMQVRRGAAAGHTLGSNVELWGNTFASYLPG